MGLNDGSQVASMTKLNLRMFRQSIFWLKYFGEPASDQEGETFMLQAVFEEHV